MEVVELLLEKDQSAIFDKDEDDNTALHLASTAGMTKTVELLLHQGASVQQRNDLGWTALDCAAASGAFGCARLLLSHDSPVDPMDLKKTTPLHLTAIYGHPRITDLLLRHGASTSMEDDQGRNVLELAIIKHQEVGKDAQYATFFKCYTFSAMERELELQITTRQWQRLSLKATSG